jgi:hypothetical protein
VNPLSHWPVRWQASASRARGGHFILYKESLLAAKLVYAFNKHIIRNYGILKEIINNRDKPFILRF